LPDDDFQLGRPVSRVLFDTSKPFERAREGAQIARFLRALSADNPYMSRDGEASDDGDDG
jgi:hypothetical protein